MPGCRLPNGMQSGSWRWLWGSLPLFAPSQTPWLRRDGKGLSFTNLCSWFSLFLTFVVYAEKTKSFLSYKGDSIPGGIDLTDLGLQLLSTSSLFAERISLPVPVPRKRRPLPCPRPQTAPDMLSQPPVPRPRSKLTEVLALLGGLLSRCAGSLLLPTSAHTCSTEECCLASYRKLKSLSNVIN